MPRNITNKFKYYKFRRNRFRHNKFRRNSFRKSKKRILIPLFIIIIIVIIIPLSPHFFRDTYKVTITNKRIVTVKNTEVYLIYALKEDGKVIVFKNTNNFLEMKFNSEDLYWAMSINKKYEIRAYGFNMPLFSNYQNIAEIKGISN